MARKILAVLMGFIMVFSLCGCDLFVADTAELLSPPALSGDLKDIAQAITKSVSGEYILKYPSRGNYRSAVVREDINNDGILEAFAFYSMTDGEIVTMHINAISNVGGEWNSVAQNKIIAGGIDMLDFCDLDNDGVKEILVGWEIYGTSEMQLAVYSIGENTLTQRMLQKYTHFVTCDLDEDSKNEILVIKTSSAEQINSASLFLISPEGVTETSFCELDSTAKTINEPVIATLSNGKPAVYIDEIKGVGAVTEVLFMEKGNLVNPLFQADKRETVATLRSVFFSIDDINGDGIMEIPVQENIPSVTSSEVSEKLYLTRWCSFNGETLTTQLTAMMNVDDGYRYTVPQKWIGSIAVLKDTSNRLRELYRYNPQESTVGESLIYIKAVPKKDWEKGKYGADGAVEIATSGETVFICRISQAAINEGLTIENVKANFKLFE